MQIEYKNRAMEKVCTNAAFAAKKYGCEIAGKLHMRLDEISNADNVEQMLQYRVGRCHKLQGTRKDQYAVDLTHPYRLIFEKHGDEIQIANIIEIVDYH